jgi:selenide,water dikinase
MATDPPAAATPGSAAPRRLLLVGGGHAHLELLARLAGLGPQATPVPAGWQVTLVSPHARQLYSGMVPGWVAGHYTLDECAISLTALADRAGIGFSMTAATGVDLAGRTVRCADGQVLPFDLLSVDTGPEPALAALPGAAEHGLPVRPIEDFVARWPGIVERWGSRASTAPATQPFELVLIGSGAGAVELALAAHHRAAQLHPLHADAVRVHLIGGDAEPLAGAGSSARWRALWLLAARGVRWHGRCRATRLGPDQVEFDSRPDRAEDDDPDAAPRAERLPFDACLIVTGAAAPDWPRQAGLAVDAQGFIRVDATLRSVSHPQVFAAGDVAAYVQPRPKSGVFAVRAGPVLADNLLAACAGQPLRAWRAQRQALYLISTGDRRAMAVWGRWSLCARWVWRWKDRIDRRFVQRFRVPPADTAA